MDKDRIAGSIKQAAGSIKQTVGKLLGDRKKNEAREKAEDAIGGLKDTAREMRGKEP